MKKQQCLVASMSCHGATPVLFWIHRGKAHAVSSRTSFGSWNLEMDWIHAQEGTKAGWIDARNLCHLSPATYTLPPSTHLDSHPTSLLHRLPPFGILHPFLTLPPCLMPPYLSLAACPCLLPPSPWSAVLQSHGP